MTAADLIEILQELPPEMEVVFPNGDALISPCPVSSDVIEIEGDGVLETLFLIRHCRCNDREGHDEFLGIELFEELRAEEIRHNPN